VVYLYLCYFSSSDVEEVTVWCEMFSVLFHTSEINRIFPNRGNLLCFIMLSVAVTFIETKSILSTESGITREYATRCVLCSTQTCVSPQAIMMELLTLYWFVKKVFIFLQHVYRLYQCKLKYIKGKSHRLL
jgi:hypothetical protein